MPHVIAIEANASHSKKKNDDDHSLRRALIPHSNVTTPFKED